MKTTPMHWMIGGVLTLIVVAAAPSKQSYTEMNIEKQDQNILFPENVMAVIDAKCMGCHKPDAKNEKARTKLQWVLLADMPVDDLVAKLDAIMETLTEGTMPPKGVLEKYPDMKLTEEETKILADWANTNVDRLIGE